MQEESAHQQNSNLLTTQLFMKDSTLPNKLRPRIKLNKLLTLLMKTNYSHQRSTSNLKTLREKVRSKKFSLVMPREDRKD
jgi:hypothetical protein